jgi:galactokinase
MLSKEAENHPIVGSNCGLLDQATSALGAADKGVLLTYDVEGLGGTTSKQFEFNGQPEKPDGKSFAEQKFVVVTCPEISRQLAGTKYNEMASDVKTSLTLLRNLGILNNYQGYGDLSPAEFANETPRILQLLNIRYSPEIAIRMFARITHEVEENARATEMITAAETGNVEDFAKAMVAGGESSVGLHRVGELTNGSTVFELPVFLAIMNTFADREQGVMAAKNCGGGGNMTSVLMVDASAVDSLSEMLGSIKVDDDPSFMESLLAKVTQNYRTQISSEVLRETVIKLMRLNREQKIVFTPTVPGPGAGIVYNTKKV